MSSGAEKLFVWNRTFQNNLKDIRKIYSEASIYAETSKPSRLCRSIYEATKCFIETVPSRHVYLGYSETDGSYCAELGVKDDADRIQVCKIMADGRVFAGIYNKRLKTIEDSFKVGADAHDGTIIFFALMSRIYEDVEAEGIINDITKLGLMDHPSDSDFWLTDKIDTLSEELCVLTSNIYSRMVKMTGEKQEIKISVPASGTFFKLRIADFSENLINSIGTPIAFNSTSKKEKKAKTVEAVKYDGMYALDATRTWNKNEEMLIPKVPSWYVMPEWVERTAKRFKASSKFATPMRNAMFSGPSGTGKTEGAKMVFALLGIPYTKTTCSVDTDIFNFLGQVFPNMGSKSPINFATYMEDKGYPTVEEIMFDATESYKRLTGKDAPDGVDSSECYAILIQKLIATLKEDMSNDKDLVYVESDLIKAIRYGYGHEIQEPTVIRRAGVLVGLNAILENGDNAFITLPTGEVVKKHKDCCIIITTNTDYEGCESINQSVLSRMDMVETIDNPEEEDIISRIQKKTGFPVKKILKRMVSVMSNINKKCNDDQITDGVCGMREIENWVKSVWLSCEEQGIEVNESTGEEDIPDELIYREAQNTIINKSSQTEEDRVEINLVLKTQFDCM